MEAKSSRSERSRGPLLDLLGRVPTDDNLKGTSVASRLEKFPALAVRRARDVLGPAWDLLSQKGREMAISHEVFVILGGGKHDDLAERITAADLVRVAEAAYRLI